MKTKYLIFILSLLSPALLAQNDVFIDTSYCDQGDTLLIEVKANTMNEFVSYQFDLQLDSGIIFIENSEVLHRGDGHALLTTQLNDSTFRFIAYSMTNNAFLSDTGAVLSFYIIAPSEGGNYAIHFSDAILGNNVSQNIINGLQDGVIIVEGIITGWVANLETEYRLQICGNPVCNESFLSLEISHPSIAHITIIEMSGKVLLSNKLRLNQGHHEIRLNIPSHIKERTLLLSVVLIDRQNKQVYQNTKKILL